MGFWNKLGKIALQAAPYVAAPFTAGASLYAVPATQKLGEKWASHDYNEAIKKGVAPSKFDKYLGMASNVASLASGTGALGKFGSAAYSGAAKAASAGAGAASKASKVANTAKTLSGWQNKLKQGGQIASMAMGGSPYAGQAGQPMDERGALGGGGALGGWQGTLASGLGEVMRDHNPSGGLPPTNTSDPVANQAQRTSGVMPQGGFGWNQNPMNQYYQNIPNLATSIFQGRQEAMRGQPFRGGSTVYSQGPEEGQVITQQMPPMFPQYEAPPTPIANQVQQQQAPNPYGDELTPRMPTKRRRNPEPVEEEMN